MKSGIRLLILAIALTLTAAMPALAGGMGDGGYRDARGPAPVSQTVHQPAPAGPHMADSPIHDAPRPADWNPGRTASLVYISISTALSCLHGSVSW